MSETFSNPLTEESVLEPGGFVGRFELRRILGQGAQSTVWLAFDPRMEREVAIKVQRPIENADDPMLAQWLQEARSAGRVSHPNIVPVFEADVHGRHPYLVFEYVTGETLDTCVRRRGLLPIGESVALVMDVLDALAVAHNAGVVHRDVKPSNILLDSAGRARVMDFGIAARIWTGSGPGPIAALGGTLGYISPEAANGLAPSPSMDIYSAGVVLAELLSGKPLRQEADPYRAVYRAVHETLELPQQLPVPVDDALRTIVNRSLALEPGQRFPSARAFQQALEQWVGQGAAGTSGTGSSGTLDFLMRRMRHKSDFPALSDAIVRIQSMASSDKESVGSVTTEILKDVALTNKLLRLVNSAHYARGGNISTVSRAVSLVGFNGIRNMALSLVLLEHMQDKAHAAQLKEEFLRALMAGSIAAELCPTARDSEEAFIGSMFQNLGRLLAQFYFPEEAQQIRQLTQSKREPVTEAAAAQSVLGMQYEDLGIGIAKAWGLPQNLIRCMRKPEGKPLAVVPQDGGEHMRWVATASNDIADVLLHCERKEADVQVENIVQKYARVVGSSPREMQSATRKAREKMVDLAAAMEIRVTPHSAAARLIKLPDDAPVQSGRAAQDAQDAQEADSGLAPLALHATGAFPADPAAKAQHKAVKNPRVTEMLTAGIQDITNAMVDDFKLSDVLRMILEAMYRALEFDRVIFCMRDPKTEVMSARFGLGEGVEQLVPMFKTHLHAATPDLFGVVCIKGADSLISDASESRIQQRLPQWYLKGIHAPTFLLLPLQIKGAPFGLIYADKKVPGGLELDEKELSLLRTLRNQAVMAFKQSS